MLSIGLEYAITAVLFLMNFKWILIVALFPFQIINSRRIKNEHKTKRRIWWWYLASVPYLIWERKIMHDGWQRYMLFQIGLVPSLNLRKWVYKCLGAEIGHDVVFHFKTEVRAPERLVVMGGGQSSEIMSY